MLHKVARGCWEELVPPRSICPSHLQRNLEPRSQPNHWMSFPLWMMQLPPGCQHSWCSLSWSSPPSLSFGARAKQQLSASTGCLHWEFHWANSCDVLGAGSGEACAAGRIQGWEMSVNPALCYWKVSTPRFLIIQALIKDFGGELLLFLWDQREMQLLQCLLPVLTQLWSCCCIHSHPATASSWVKAPTLHCGLKSCSVIGNRFLPGNLGPFTLKMSSGSWFLFQQNCKEFMKHKDWRGSKTAFPGIWRNWCKEKQYSLCSTTSSQPQQAPSLLLPFHDLNAPET